MGRLNNYLFWIMIFVQGVTIHAQKPLIRQVPQNYRPSVGSPIVGHERIDTPITEQSTQQEQEISAISQDIKQRERERMSQVPIKPTIYHLQAGQQEVENLIEKPTAAVTPEQIRQAEVEP